MAEPNHTFVSIEKNLFLGRNITFMILSLLSTVIPWYWILEQRQEFPDGIDQVEFCPWSPN